MHLVLTLYLLRLQLLLSKLHLKENRGTKPEITGLGSFQDRTKPRYRLSVNYLTPPFSNKTINFGSLSTFLIAFKLSRLVRFRNRARSLSGPVRYFPPKTNMPPPKIAGSLFLSHSVHSDMTDISCSAANNNKKKRKERLIDQEVGLLNTRKMQISPRDVFFLTLSLAQPRSIFFLATRPLARSSFYGGLEIGTLFRKVDRIILWKTWSAPVVCPLSCAVAFYVSFYCDVTNHMQTNRYYLCGHQKIELSSGVCCSDGISARN